MGLVTAELFDLFVADIVDAHRGIVIACGCPSRLIAVLRSFFKDGPKRVGNYSCVMVIVLSAVQIDPSSSKVQNEPNKRDIVAAESS